MISVEEIEPQEAAQEAAPEAVPAPEPEVIDEEPAPAEAEASVVDIADVPAPPPLERAAPKKRGRPKAAPKEKPAPKPKGRPRKVVVPEESVEEVQHYVPQPTDEQLHEYAPLCCASTPRTSCAVARANARTIVIFSRVCENEEAEGKKLRAIP